MFYENQIIAADESYIFFKCLNVSMGTIAFYNNYGHFLKKIGQTCNPDSPFYMGEWMDDDPFTGFAIKLIKKKYF